MKQALKNASTLGDRLEIDDDRHPKPRGMDRGFVPGLLHEMDTVK